MNAFTPGFVQAEATTAKERGYAASARKATARQQAELDRCGPVRTPSAQQKAEAAAKSARIRTVGSV